MSSKNVRNSTYTRGNLPLGAWPWKDAPCVSEAGEDLDAAVWERKDTTEMWGHVPGKGPCFPGADFSVLSCFPEKIKHWGGTGWFLLGQKRATDRGDVPQGPGRGTPQPPSSPLGMPDHGLKEEEICSHPQLSQH